MKEQARAPLATPCDVCEGARNPGQSVITSLSGDLMTSAASLRLTDALDRLHLSRSDQKICIKLQYSVKINLVLRSTDNGSKLNRSVGGGLFYINYNLKSIL